MEFKIEKLTELINEISDSGEIPEDLSTSIFIALPPPKKNPGCELHTGDIIIKQVEKSNY